MESMCGPIYRFSVNFLTSQLSGEWFCEYIFKDYSVRKPDEIINMSKDKKENVDNIIYKDTIVCIFDTYLTHR